MANENGAAKGGWKLQEIIFVAMLCVVFGVVYLVAVYAAAAMVAAFTPMGIGPMGNEIVFGIWFMVSTLAAYIIQRPGVALVSELVSSMLFAGLLSKAIGDGLAKTGLLKGYALGRSRA